MKLRRPIVVLGVAAASLLGVCAVPASAGIQFPHDILATPSAGTVGQVVVITNAANSPCGGQQGDGPAQVNLSVTKPDTTTVTDATVLADASGNWTYSYTTTDQVGTYRVAGTCVDVPNLGGAITAATDFQYNPTTFDITAPVDSSTTSSSTTTSTPAPPAPPAKPTPSNPTFTG